MRAQPYFTTEKKSRHKHKEFEEEIRELACDKRTPLDGSSKWTLRVEHGQWADFKREDAPVHHMHTKLREVSIKLVLEKLEAAIGEPFAVLSCTFGHGVAVLFQKADVLCMLLKDGVTLYSSNAEILDRLVREDVIPKVSQAKSVNLLNAGNRGIQIQFAGHIDRPLNELNYAPEVTGQIREVLSWVEGPDPFGRIVIFAGPPGTGKSFAVRALVTETQNVEWVIVPAHLVARLAGPDMVQVLLEERTEEGPLGLIVEDADSLLRERPPQPERGSLTGDLADLPIALSDVYGAANEHDTNVKEASTDGFGQYA